MMQEFTLSEDTRKNFSEILEAIQKHQIAQTRALSQMQKHLKAISTDTCGVTFEHGELLSILCDIASALSVICANMCNSVEKEDA